MKRCGCPGPTSEPYTLIRTKHEPDLSVHFRSTIQTQWEWEPPTTSRAGNESPESTQPLAYHSSRFATDVSSLRLLLLRRFRVRQRQHRYGASASVTVRRCRFALGAVSSSLRCIRRNSARQVLKGVH